MAEKEAGSVDTSYGFGGLRIPRYRTAMAQVTLVGLFAFCTVGMSNALGGAGGGGLLNTTQSTNANVAVYATFSALAFVGGTIYNRLGIKLCLAFGGVGYACLASAYLATSRIGERAMPWVVTAGCLEGLSAAMLWTAVGAVTMCYPTEETKGKAFSIFWTIFEMGGVIGSIIPICMNWSSSSDNLDDGSYIAFIVIMLCGCFIPLLLIPSDQVIRIDGSQVVLPQMPTWRTEIKGMYHVLQQNIWVLTLFPFFAASNWYYTYQANDFNVPNFTLRTRFFNGLWSNFFSMVGVWVMGTFLDGTFKVIHIDRPMRARLGIIFLFISTFVTWGSGWLFAMHSKRGQSPVPLIDLEETHRYVPYGAIYIAFAFYDGCFQSYANWILGSLSNNSATLSHYAGWYRSIQSAASAVVWRLDGLDISYRSMYISTWCILIISVTTTFYVAFLKVEGHSADEVTPSHDTSLMNKPEVKSNAEPEINSKSDEK
ncbi:UNC93-like protein [Golovinomyces cichoracearum]|uniref:UNC93-like protein n=1 Tax=Golovinomyces cichoracearum TaxID=62708 RepID=A0A420HN86_9PEZI|nr:UNC93-like protein [Golovinomyces cichoracearum]